MTAKKSFWLSLIGIGLQIATATLDAVPPKYKPLVVGGIAIGQGYVAHLAQQTNPDGTPAEVAYLPK